MTQPIPPMCPDCGAALNLGEVACAQCGALYYRQRLEMLARDATALEATDPQRAAYTWEQCLPLLPYGSQQHAHIYERIAMLRSPVIASSPSAPRPNETLPAAMAKTGVSMLISIVVYGFYFGSWQIALGFVLLIWVHEMGHVIANMYYGLRASPPIFIPFLGAVITLRQQLPNAKVEAIVGIAGPIAGTIATLACFIWAYRHPESEVATYLAWFGFAINLYNMLPVPPLDGGRVAAAMSPWIWIAGLGGLGWLVVSSYRHGRDFSILAIILVVALPRIIATLKGGLRSGPYYRIGRVAPIVIGAVYLALLGILVAGKWWADRALAAHGWL